MEGRMTSPHIVTFDPGTCGNILNDPEREITSMKLGVLIQKKYELANDLICKAPPLWQRQSHHESYPNVLLGFGPQ